MSLDPLRRLAEKWFPTDGGPIEPALDAAFDKIGFTRDPGFVASTISSYNSGGGARQYKVVKDNVWGMVELDPCSVRLLDTPIIQRLRGIKQLGFSYLTYPSAEHSRFIHSIGMYWVVARFLETTSKHTKEQNSNSAAARVNGDDKICRPVSVEDDLAIDLLHAALLHDVGHAPFSHASENIISTYPDLFRIGEYSLSDFLFDVEEILEKSLTLSEAMSLAVVLSPRFRHFYQNYVRPGKGDPNMVYRIAALISGIRPYPDWGGAADLISGEAVDADKVDYINRDANACGIPVGVDVARVFLRSSFFEVPREVLQRLDRNRKILNDPEIMFIVNASGLDTIEELAQARSALYQRVYQHRATRTAERLLAHSLSNLSDTSKRIGAPDLCDVLNIWAMDDFSLLNTLVSYWAESVSVPAKRLQTRQLPKRACVFGRPFTTTFMHIEDIFPKMPTLKKNTIFREITGIPLQNLKQNSLYGETLANLEAQISEEATQIAALLRERWPDSVPAANRPDIVTVLPMPKLENTRKDCIILENDELAYSSARTIFDEQSEGADIYKSLGYVLTDPEWCPIVLLAVCTILRNQQLKPKDVLFCPYASDDLPTYKVACVGHVTLDINRVIRRVRLNTSEVERIQKLAEQAGYYRNMPWIATPIPIHEKSKDVSRLLQDFSGQGNWRVTSRSCAAFVQQFPPTFRSEVFDVLDGMTILDRSTLSADIINAVGKYGAPKSGTGFIVPMSPDSGNFVRMLMEQADSGALSRLGWTIKKTIQEVFSIADGSEDIVLCDDNIVSGSQFECQLKAWFGIPREQWASSQRKERGIEDRQLDLRDLELLRSMSMGIAVCRGSDAAERHLTPICESLGIEKFCGVYYASSITPTKVELTEDFESFLKEVGADVLAYCRYGAENGLRDLGSEERADCEADALGYGNNRGLVSTIFNVPVSTLTALWCPGISGGNPWIPLLIRRGYLQHLVLA